MVNAKKIVQENCRKEDITVNNRLLEALLRGMAFFAFACIYICIYACMCPAF